MVVRACNSLSARLSAWGQRRFSRSVSAAEIKKATDERYPSIAQVMGILFNVMFLDHLATDLEHLEHLNQLLNDGHIQQLGIEGHEKIRSVNAFVITPSVNLSDLAEQHQRDMPALIQYFVSSLGRDAAS